MNTSMEQRVSAINNQLVHGQKKNIIAAGSQIISRNIPLNPDQRA